MRKNNLDEMQEKKLLNIEHNGMWLAFWGLLVVIIIQICVGADFKQFAGEWAIFMLLCIYTLICCIKSGIWDRRLKPNLKTNALISLLAALAVSVVSGIVSYRHNEQGQLLQLIVIPVVSTGVSTFLLSLAALQVSSYFYKRRSEKLEQECDEDSTKK